MLELKLKDPNLERFGAKDHKYLLNDTLSIDILKKFEANNQIVLPEDYKFFLTNIGNGGFGPYYGLRSFDDSLFDFKLTGNPIIEVSKKFQYNSPWNANWIETFDFENSRPKEALLKEYLDVSHISGTLAICHYGHGCIFILVAKGEERSNVWYDGRAMYEGLVPELNEDEIRISFSQWYLDWLKRFEDDMI